MVNVPGLWAIRLPGSGGTILNKSLGFGQTFSMADCLSGAHVNKQINILLTWKK